MSKVCATGSPGFTLLEMMIVILLIGILSAAIIPEMKGTFEDALLRSTSREVVGVLSLAYSRSVSLNQVHRVRFDASSRRYFLERRVPGAAGFGDSFFQMVDAPGSQGELDGRISVAFHRPNDDSGEVAGEEAVGGDGNNERGYSHFSGAIAFYPDGTADRAEIEFRDRQGFRLALQLNPVTARVHIMELPRE